MLLRAETTKRRRGVTGFDEGIGTVRSAAKLERLSKPLQKSSAKNTGGVLSPIQPAYAFA